MVDKKVIGIDVGKDELVVAVPEVKGVRKFKNTSKGIEKLRDYISKFNVKQVIVEACHYEKRVHYQLAGYGFNVHVANPRRARDFAQAAGAHGKTDPVDALMLAKYGEAMKLSFTAVPTKAEQRLRSLLKRRSELIDNRSREKNRAHKSPEMADSYERILDFLKNEIKSIDLKIDEILQENSLRKLLKNVEILESIRGVGRVTALYLAVYLPELGKLGRREIASLAGVAPRNNDSGKQRGKRFVGPGRMIVKHSLFMCVLAAVQFNPQLKTFYERLKNKGKHNLVCRVAVMKKMVILMNALIRDQRMWEPRMGL